MKQSQSRASALAERLDQANEMKTMSLAPIMDDDGIDPGMLDDLVTELAAAGYNADKDYKLDDMKGTIMFKRKPDAAVGKILKSLQIR